ncbi:BTAD domain-containing putative transcriptional regulator [Lentzea sp. NPDC034063]|uniref:AfsR/SARP family transcriptional regulator n=1 Tax=unclassified Lentzea TaxID=2643253 RepID=UPI0033FC1C56
MGSDVAASARRLPGLVFSVLGPVRVWRDGEELDLGSPQQRLTLAVLLLGRKRTLSVSNISHVLWPGDEPRAARGTVRTYVHRLRKILGDGDETPLCSVANGYQLRVSEEDVDHGRFRTLVQQAGEAHSSGDLHGAAELLHKALDEWRGVPLAGMSGEWEREERRRLEHQGIQAVEALADLELRLSGRTRLLERLAAICEAQPLRERVHELLMLALCRSGRPAEALSVYERVRTALRAELGVDPGPALREMYHRVLRSDPELTSYVASEPQPRFSTRASVPRPAQLPLNVAVFAGRAAELKAMDEHYETAGARVLVVQGTAGVGKTTFAVHWAHQVADDFPDGQLFADLRGFDAGGAARDPAEILCELLAALGYPNADATAGRDVLAARYRGALAGRRMLVLLDNVSDSGQVLPLLPDAHGSVVVITSRRELNGVTARADAATVGLDLPDEHEAVELMTRRLGERRITAEPTAAREIAALCARLPLALAIVCARAAGSPGLRMSELAERLADAGPARPDSFGLGPDDLGGDVRSVLSWSYRELSPPAARLFRLLSVVPGPSVSVGAAMGLTGLSHAAVSELMHELKVAHLLVETGDGRFSCHDLLKMLAAELFAEKDGEEQHRVAWARLLDHYLAFAHHCALQLDNHDDLPRLPAAVANSQDGEPGATGTALEAFGAEHLALVSSVRWAAENGFESHAWRLAWYLRRFLFWLGYTADLLLVSELALEAAQRVNDQEGIGYAHRLLARLAFEQGHITISNRHTAAAVTAFAAAELRLTQGHAHRQEAAARAYSGDFVGGLAAARKAHSLFVEEGREGEAQKVLATIALCELGFGEYEKAIETARTASRSDGRYVADGSVFPELASHYITGVAREKIGDDMAAVEAFEKYCGVARAWATATEFDHPSARQCLTVGLWRLADLLCRLGDHEKASVALAEGLRTLRIELAAPSSSDHSFDRADRRYLAVMREVDRAIEAQLATEAWCVLGWDAFRGVVDLAGELGFSSFLQIEAKRFES